MCMFYILLCSTLLFYEKNRQTKLILKLLYEFQLGHNAARSNPKYVQSEWPGFCKSHYLKKMVCKI